MQESVLHKTNQQKVLKPGQQMLQLLVQKDHTQQMQSCEQDAEKQPENRKVETII
jgi:hypothetical protein